MTILSKCWYKCKATVISHFSRENAKWYSHFKVWQFLINLNIYPPYKPAIILLDIYSKNRSEVDMGWGWEKGKTKEYLKVIKLSYMLIGRWLHNNMHSPKLTEVCIKGAKFALCKQFTWIKNVERQKYYTNMWQWFHFAISKSFLEWVTYVSWKRQMSPANVFKLPIWQML